MTPRRNIRHSVSPSDARAYLSKSEAWLEAAVESLDACRWDVAAGSAVTAGISACDAITGALVGQRAGGEHVEALSLLATAGDDGRYAARQLSQLLRFKTPAQYDPAPLRGGRTEGCRVGPAAYRQSRHGDRTTTQLVIGLERLERRFFERVPGTDDLERTTGFEPATLTFGNK